MWRFPKLHKLQNKFQIPIVVRFLFLKVICHIIYRFLIIVYYIVIDTHSSVVIDSARPTHQLQHYIAVPAKPPVVEQVTTKKPPRYNSSRPRVSRRRRLSNIPIVNIPNPNVRTFHVDLTIDSIQRELVAEKITKVQELVAKVDNETKGMDADMAARAVNILLGNRSDDEHLVAGEAILRRLEYLF